MEELTFLTITVRDLLLSVDRSHISKLLVQSLHVSSKDVSEAQACIEQFIHELLALEPVQNDNVILAMLTPLNPPVAIFPMTSAHFQQLLNMEECDLPRLEQNQRMLIVTPLEQVLAMSVILFETNHVDILINNLDQVAHLILQAITFLGISISTRKQSDRTLLRNVILSEISKQQTISVGRVIPWYVDGTALVDVEEVIHDLKKDECFTFFRVFSDIWGVLEWNPTQYKVLAVCFAEKNTLDKNRPIINISMNRLTSLCHCSAEDVMMAINMVEECFAWTMYNGIPHRIKLICQHIVEGNRVTLYLDEALIKLYNILQNHLESALCIILSAGKSEQTEVMISAELIFAGSNYGQKETFKVPVDVIHRNFPIDTNEFKASQADRITENASI